MGWLVWLWAVVCALGGVPWVAEEIRIAEEETAPVIQVQTFRSEESGPVTAAWLCALPKGVTVDALEVRRDGEWVAATELSLGGPRVSVWRIGRIPAAAQLRVRVHSSQEGYDPRYEPAILANRPVVVPLDELDGALEHVEAGLNADTDITVFDAPDPVDPHTPGIGTSLTRAMMDKLPNQRNQHDILRLAPGVQGTGNPSMGGGSGNENQITIDGTTITDGVTGTFAQHFSFDALQGIDLHLGGYMPEHGTSLGGVIAMQTASGTNNLELNTSAYASGGLFRARMDERLTADGLTLAPTGFDSVSRSLQANLLVSGPIARDKLWAMLSYQHERSALANTGIPQTRDYNAHYVMGKLTTQPSAAHRLSLLATMDPTTIDNINQSNPFQKSESQPRQAQGSLLLQGRWQWFPTDAVTAEATVATQKTSLEQHAVPCTHDPERDDHPCEPGELQGNVDWETPGRTGIGGAFSSVNYGQYVFDDRWRHSVNLRLGRVDLEDPWQGRHDLKVGLEGSTSTWDQLQGVAGNLLFADINEVPFDPSTLQNYYWLETTGPIDFRTSGLQWSAWAQDAWKPIPTLSVNYGLRYDRFVMRNDLQEPVLDGGMLGPRAYVAWDPSGRGRTKLSTGWGRFNDPGRLGVASFLSAATYGSHLYLGEFFGGTFPAGVLNDTANDYDTDTGETRRSAAPDLGVPHVDEVILQIHQQLARDFAVRSDLTARWTRNQYVYDEENLLWDSDGSAVIGSRQADPTQPWQRMRTPTVARRDYARWDLTLHKVHNRRWEASGTWSLTASRGTTVQALDSSFANAPQTQFNYGPLNTDVLHTVNGWAWWDLPTDPWAQTLGATLEYQSGAPEERLYLAENATGSGLSSQSLRIRPRGTYLRLEPSWSAGLRFQQTFTLRRGELAVDATLLNLFDNRAPVQADLGFLDSNNRLLVRTRQPGREATVGIRYRF